MDKKRFQKLCLIVFAVSVVLILLTSIVNLIGEAVIDKAFAEFGEDEFGFISYAKGETVNQVRSLLTGGKLSLFKSIDDAMGGSTASAFVPYMDGWFNSMIQEAIDEIVPPFYKMLLYIWAYTPHIRDVAFICCAASAVIWWLMGGRLEAVKRMISSFGTKVKSAAAKASAKGTPPMAKPPVIDTSAMSVTPPMAKPPVIDTSAVSETPPMAKPPVIDTSAVPVTPPMAKPPVIDTSAVPVTPPMAEPPVVDTSSVTTVKIWTCTCGNMNPGETDYCIKCRKIRNSTAVDTRSRKVAHSEEKQSGNSILGLLILLIAILIVVGLINLLPNMNSKESIQPSTLEATATPTQKANTTSTASSNQVSITQSAMGLLSEVKVTFTVNDDHTIASIVVDCSGEPGTSAAPCTEDVFLSQFIGKKGPFFTIDVVAGATATSYAVVEALNTYYVSNGSPSDDYMADASTSDNDFDIYIFGDECKIKHYTGTSEHLVIPATIDGKKVTAIGVGAFSHCPTLKSVIICEGVRAIDEGAFRQVPNLTSVTLPDSLKVISRDMFAHCYSLNSITIPEGVTRICDNAFTSCSSLETVYIPESVTYIDAGVFGYCGNVTLMVHRDSYAHQWAKMWKLTYAFQ